MPGDKQASQMDVEVPLPKYVQRVHCDVDGRQQAVRAARLPLVMACNGTRFASADYAVC